MNDKIKNILLISSLLGTDEYESLYIEDEKVNDCLMKMYFFMLLNESDNRKEKMYIEFCQEYDKLNNEQQEIVKKEYLNIINAQNNKDKVKKKGMINYE